MSLEKESSTTSSGAISIPELTIDSNITNSSKGVEDGIEKESVFSNSGDESDLDDEDDHVGETPGEEEDLIDDPIDDTLDDQADEYVANTVDNESEIDEDELGDVEKLQKDKQSKLASESIPLTEQEKLETMLMGDSETSTGSVEDYSTDEDDEEYLQKFNAEVGNDYILDFHPEKKIHNYEEVKNFSKIKRDKQNNIVDLFHKTTPILTKYERTKVLGQRAKQIDEGASPMIDVGSNIIDGYIIALEELKQKKLPFIIRRPIPNGGVEYWPVKELEVIQ